MRIQRICSGWVGLLFASALLFSAGSRAANINIHFSGFISPGSCDVSLSRSSLDLGNVDMLSLKAGDVLANTTDFNVSVMNCYLSMATTFRPAVQIDGEGFDANGKFLFRSRDSVSKGIGIQLNDSSGNPLKAGEYIDLGGPGSVPGDSLLPFFVGVTCGSAADCAASNMTPGRLIARIVFNFRYY